MFDTVAFLKKHFANPQQLINSLEAYGFAPPQLDAVKKWFSRGSVPGSWLIMLLAILELENGEPVSVAEFVRLPR